MDDLREILSRLEDKMDGMRMELAEIREKMATTEDVQQVADTLESIAVGEVAAAKEKLEDRDDARDVLLKTLLDGLENRLTDQLVGLAEGLKLVAKNQETTLKLLRQFGRELRELENRVDELGA